ncbi:hypothetical protein CDAR_48391 [Caerostris darwini]|uniref:Uncharacterized protein n=1 Tax=Caerostris darwini TaxID=1538125 RepID=A0AAV4NLR6_9ARAC|nr:hypothetical protein CDAR_48391 [Caerostris darwini]
MFRCKLVGWAKRFPLSLISPKRIARGFLAAYQTNREFTTHSEQLPNHQDAQRWRNAADVHLWLTCLVTVGIRSEAGITQ